MLSILKLFNKSKYKSKLSSKTAKTDNQQINTIINEIITKASKLDNSEILIKFKNKIHDDLIDIQDNYLNEFNVDYIIENALYEILNLINYVNDIKPQSLQEQFLIENKLVENEKIKL